MKFDCNLAGFAVALGEAIFSINAVVAASAST
jgi:hypothetical protein